MTLDFHPGQIYSLELGNFMTYDHMKVFFDPYINFVIGPNGNGKSSIVSGICLGLGGSVYTLGKTGDIRQFIKHSKDIAVITTTIVGYPNLKNKTNISYESSFNNNTKPKTAPAPLIEIQRFLYRRGIVGSRKNSPTWKLNSRQVPSEDICNLLQAYSINVNSLCQFLAQDRVIQLSKLTPSQLLFEVEKNVRIDKKAHMGEIRKLVAAIDDYNLKNETDKTRPITNNYLLEESFIPHKIDFNLLKAENSLLFLKKTSVNSPMSLGDLHEALLFSSSNIKRIEAAISKLADLIADFERKKDLVKEDFDAEKEYKKLKLEVEERQSYLVSEKILVKEIELENIKRKYSQGELKKEKALREIKENEDNMEDLTKKLAALSKSKLVIQEKIDNFNLNVKTQTNLIAQRKQEVLSGAREIALYKEKILENSEKIIFYKNLVSSACSSLDSFKQKHSEDISKALELREEINVSISSLDSKISEITNSISSLTKSKEALESSLSKKTNEFLDSLEKERENRIRNMLGPSSLLIYRKVRKLKERKAFRGKVVGPLLLEVVTKSRLVSMVLCKHVPANTRGAYVVEYMEDEKMLSYELRKAQLGVTFFVHKSNQPNTSSQGLSNYGLVSGEGVVSNFGLVSGDGFGVENGNDGELSKMNDFDLFNKENKEIFINTLANSVFGDPTCIEVLQLHSGIDKVLVLDLNKKYNGLNENSIDYYLDGILSSQKHKDNFSKTKQNIDEKLRFLTKHKINSIYTKTQKIKITTSRYDCTAFNCTFENIKGFYNSSATLKIISSIFTAKEQAFWAKERLDFNSFREKNSSEWKSVSDALKNLINEKDDITDSKDKISYKLAPYKALLTDLEKLELTVSENEKKRRMYEQNNKTLASKTKDAIQRFQKNRFLDSFISNINQLVSAHAPIKSKSFMESNFQLCKERYLENTRELCRRMIEESRALIGLIDSQVNEKEYIEALEEEIERMRKSSAGLKKLTEPQVSALNKIYNLSFFSSPDLQNSSPENNQNLSENNFNSAKVINFNRVEQDIQSRLSRLELLSFSEKNLQIFSTASATISQLTFQKSSLASTKDRICSMHASLINSYRALARASVRNLNASFASLFRSITNSSGKGLINLIEDSSIENFSIEISIKFRQEDNMKALAYSIQSGGEKSLCTMVFLLALQNTSTASFRLVDEINQGMDAGNERELLRMLRENVRRVQYFVVTPKLLPGLEFDGLVRVHFVVKGPLVESEGCLEVVRGSSEARVVVEGADNYTGKEESVYVYMEEEGDKEEGKDGDNDNGNEEEKEKEEGKEKKEGKEKEKEEEDVRKKGGFVVGVGHMVPSRNKRIRKSWNKVREKEREEEEIEILGSDVEGGGRGRTLGEQGEESFEEISLS